MAEEWADLSHHRPIDVEAYFDAGYSTVGWKVTEGTGYEDPTWRAAWAVASRRGKRFVGYHFDRARFSGADQLDWFLGRWLAGAGGRLRAELDVLCLDSEDTDTPARAAASAAEFTARAVARGYPTGIVYSGPWYSTPNRVRLDVLPPEWRYGWVSDYTTGQADSAIELSPGWPRERIVARQYTSTHPWPGQAQGVDFNRTLTAWPDAAQEVDDMAAFSDADRAKLVAAADQILKSIGAGQTTTYGTVQAILATAQNLVNLQREEQGVLAARIGGAQAAVLDAVSAVLSGQVDQSARLDALAAALAALNLPAPPVSGDITITGVLHADTGGTP